MKKIVLLVSCCICLISCDPTKRTAEQNKKFNTPHYELLDLNTFKIDDIASDAKYGYTRTQPVKVGGEEMQEGILNARRYLNGLLGPDGEKVKYKHAGTCCYYDLPKDHPSHRVGSLDRYEIRYEGSPKKAIIFINIYEYEETILKAPRGYTFKM